MPSPSSQRPSTSPVRMNIGLKLKLLSLLIATASSTPAMAADLATQQKLPLFSIQNLEYLGGFRYALDVYGASDIKYAQGPIAVGKDGASMYAVGHTYQQAIGEFKIPTLVKSSKISDFNRAPIVQNFSKVLDRAASGNGQGIDRIGGMAYINGQLVVNAYVYYDASGGTTHTTLAVKDASKLATSAVAGYHRYSARAHATGWITPIPSDWQLFLGGTYITGDSSGKPIISRLSVGPSAFAFDPTNPLLGDIAPSAITLTKLLDYDLDHALGTSTSSVNIDSYLYNTSKTNNLWTHLSGALVGFVIPGTRTYLTIGNTGGIESGIGYKITQDNGNVCFGHCAYKASDYHNYYWAWDLNDMIKVKNGQMQSYDVRPYAYGKLTLPIGYNLISGGTFDATKGIVYLNIDSAERLEYDSAPVVLAYKVPLPSGEVQAQPPQPPSNITIVPTGS